MKILLTGKNGQVGWELQRTLCTVGDVVAFGSADLDVADADAIVRAVRAVKPDLIVNPAAYTAVDKAESEPELAMAVNGHAPGILAEEAKRLGALLVHYSTDYVFDGSKDEPYVETDAPHPLSVYGRSKREGEQRIQAVECRHLIFRTSWVYGLRGKNFLLTMQRLLTEKPELKVVNDQYGAPTWSRLIANVTAQAIRPAQIHAIGGLFHLSCAGEGSWFDFASAIAADLRQTSQAVAQIHPIPTADYPTPARRPANSRLSCRALHVALGLRMPDWREALRLCMADEK
jgi:dTDP-4-dehydrorhamnose reductase